MSILWKRIDVVMLTITIEVYQLNISSMISFRERVRSPGRPARELWLVEIKQVMKVS